MVKISSTSLIFIISVSYLMVLSKGNLIIKEFNANSGELYEDVVNSTQEIYYKFNLADMPFYEEMKIQVRTSVAEESKDETRHYPLMFTIRQRHAVTSWQLPVLRKGNLTVFQMSRTLCFDFSMQYDHHHEEKNIQVDVFTESPENLKFQLEVVATPDYIAEANNLTSMNLSSLSSNFYFFDFANYTAEFALIKIHSSDSNCTVVSLQPPRCPVYASESDVQFHGRWITVTKTAGISVRRDDYPTGFYLVFVALMTNVKCEHYQGIGPPDPESSSPQSSELRLKMVEFKIMTLKGDPSTSALALIGPLLVYCAVISIILIVFSFFHRVKHGMVNSKPSECISSDPLLSPSNPSVIQRFKEKFSSPVKITDLIKMDITRLEKKSKRFYWAIIVVSVFYFLPVCQLAFLYLKVVYRTGDDDLCYYNFLCANSLGYLKDFNHVYSNIGYVIFGIIFIVLVRIKHSRLRNLDKACISEDRYHDEIELDEFESAPSSTTDNNCADRSSVTTTSSFWMKVFPDIVKTRDCGVFYHFGLFYAMGIALTLQGFLSGAYHVCPTQTNFQFDASFMYVLVILTIVKLYQFRHPIYVNANVTFVSLALIAIWAYIGLEVNNNSAFKIAFAIFHLLCIFNLLLYQYYVGYLRIKNVVATNIFQVYRYTFSKLRHLVVHRDLKTFRRHTIHLNVNSNHVILQAFDYTPNRALLPTLAVALNILVTVLNFTYLADKDFASQVLGILIVNSLVYIVYYMLMKFIHNEYKGGMWLQTSIYSAMAICLWVPSLKFFTTLLTSWDKAPAESRERNQDCFLLGFYDFHDAWHFLSAAALFCSFLVLLTIDDDLIATSKADIAVF